MSDFATIRRGETFTISLGPRQASETLRVACKRAGAGGAVPPLSAAETAVFTVTESDDVNGADGWIAALSASQTAGMAAGRYIFDGRIVLSGGAVQMTDPLVLLVQDRVTGAAP